MKNLLLIRVTSDIHDLSVENLFSMAVHFGIDVERKDIKTKDDLDNALNSGQKYDYIYFAGHGDKTCLTDNCDLTLSWDDIGVSICSSECLNENSIIMLCCCKGGLSDVSFSLIAACDNVQYVCGAKQNVTIVDLMIGFNTFLYNVEKRNIDPVLAAEKSTLATEIRFQCHSRDDVEFNPMYYNNFCKTCD